MYLISEDINVTEKGKGREVTKKIFKSTMLVCLVVMTMGLFMVLGILYGNFGGQLQRELVKEAAYLGYGVEQQGAEYLQNVSDKNSRITYIDQDGIVLFDQSASNLFIRISRWLSHEIICFA